MNKNDDNILFMINHIAKVLIFNKVDFEQFKENPKKYLKQYDIDFNVEENNRFVLFSEYLTKAHPSIKNLILQNIKSSIINIHTSKRLKDHEQEISWIEDISGGIPVPGVIAFANVAAAANVAIVANAGALANAAANANAIANANISVSINVMSRSSGIAAASGVSASSADEIRVDHKKVFIDKNAISRELYLHLKKTGLNSYRQTALIKYLIMKKIDSNRKSGEINLVVVHENIKMNLEIKLQDNSAQLKRAYLYNK